jgi:hypothetical protein
MESSPTDAGPLKRPVPVRPASIRYMGFECTAHGRSYRLRVDGADEPRLFTVTIPNEAFESRVFRLWTASRETRDLEKAFGVMGTELQLARERYEHIKSYDREGFEGTGGVV